MGEWVGDSETLPYLPPWLVSFMLHASYCNEAAKTSVAVKDRN